MTPVLAPQALGSEIFGSASPSEAEPLVFLHDRRVGGTDFKRKVPEESTIARKAIHDP